MEKELLAFVTRSFVLATWMIGGVGCPSICGRVLSRHSCLWVGGVLSLERECAVVLVHVTRVVGACLVADKEPSETTADGFNEIPWVETFDHGLEPQESTMVSDLTVDVLRIVGSLLCLQSVWLPWESEEVKNGEEGHFNTQKKIRYPDVDVLVC